MLSEQRTQEYYIPWKQRGRVSLTRSLFTSPSLALRIMVKRLSSPKISFKYSCRFTVSFFSGLVKPDFKKPNPFFYSELKIVRNPSSFWIKFGVSFST